MPLVPHNPNVVCWVIPRGWTMPELENIGPKRPIPQVPRHLGAHHRRDVQRIVASRWLLVDCTLLSLILQNSSTTTNRI